MARMWKENKQPTFKLINRLPSLHAIDPYPHNIYSSIISAICPRRVPYILSCVYYVCILPVSEDVISSPVKKAVKIKTHKPATHLYAERRTCNIVSYLQMTRRRSTENVIVMLRRGMEIVHVFVVILQTSWTRLRSCAWVKLQRRLAIIL